MRMTFQTAAIATMGAVIGSVSLTAAPAEAAQFAADFSVDIISGNFLVGETFSGQVVYEDDFITGIGTELLDPASGLLSLSFAYVGADLTTPVTYTEANDDIDSGFPILTFRDGELTGLDYSVSITQAIAFQFVEEPLGSSNFVFLTDDFTSFQTNTGTLTFSEPTPQPTSVPEPAVLVGLVAMAGITTLQRR